MKNHTLLELIQNLYQSTKTNSYLHKQLAKHINLPCPFIMSSTEKEIWNAWQLRDKKTNAK